MKKQLNISAIIILVATILFSVSCKQENDLKGGTTFERTFNIKPVSKTNKLDLTNYQIKSSTSTIDFVNGQINLEIPLPLSDFHFTKAYNISTNEQPAILVVISRDATDVVQNLPVNYVVNTNISFDEVNLDSSLLDANANLNVYVMNTTRVFNDDDAVLNCFADNNTEDSLSSCVQNSTNKGDSADGPDVSENGSIIITD